MDARTLAELAAVADPVERARAASRALASEQEVITELARIRRQAIAEAQDDGVRQAEIEPHPRVLVERALPTPPAVRGAPSLFLAEAERQGLESARRMLYVGPEPSNEHVAAGLRVEPGATVIARRKMFTANGVPVRVATSYFRMDVAEGTRLAGQDFVRPTLQAAIENLGHRFGHAVETLTARPPAPYEIEILDLDPGEWVVQVLRVAHSTEDTPVHALETICSASRHVFPIGQASGTDQF